MDIYSPTENVCRTCMGEKWQEKTPKRYKANSLISIFTEPETLQNSGNTIMDLLRQTNPQLTIETDDLLPKTICSTCVDKLLDTHDFQRMCIRVEQRLRETVIKVDQDEELYEHQPDPLNSYNHPFNDLSRVLKVEMDELDEPMIDDAEIMDDKNAMEIYKAEEEPDEDDNQYDRGLQSSSSSDEENSDWDWESGDKSINDNKFDHLESNKQQNIDVTISTVDHKEIIEKRKPFVCVACGRRLKTLKSLERHRERLHTGRPVSNRCRFCKKVFEKKSWLRKHMTTHSESRRRTTYETKANPESCTNDGNNINIKLKLEEDNVDSLCTESMKSTENRPEDIQETKDCQVDPKAKEKNKPFYCLICAYGLKSQESWDRHIKKVHSGVVPEAKIYKCKHCGKVYDDFNLLKEHWKEHAVSEKSCLCPECGKSFATLGSMSQHLLRHGTALPYECPHCPLRYKTLSSLASHKQMHSTEKPHVCDVCGMAFASPSILKTHKKYHTGEKNYKCDYCEMRFVLGSQCRTHMRIHTGEKPFKCKYCTSSFKQGGDLKKHLRTHLGINVYRCTMCPQAFRLNSILRQHLISHKNEDDETRLRNLEALKEEELRLQMKFNLVATFSEEQ